jgi:hypothetical protein
MNRTLLLAAIFTTFLTPNAFSQITHQWSMSVGGTGQDGMYENTIDASGNIYTCGYFKNTVDFDPSTSVNNLSVTVGTTKGDAFVQKLDAQQNFLWAKSFSSSSGEHESAKSIATDANNNVYVLGTYNGYIQLDPSDTSIWGGGVTTSQRPFLVKLDSAGNYQWGYGWKTTGSSGEMEALKLLVDASGKIFIGGYYSGTVDFDPTNNSNQSYSSTSREAFLLRISTTGTLEKVRTISSSNKCLFNTMEFDQQSNLYFTGNFQGSIDFDNGSGSQIVNSSGTSSMYLSKVDTGFSHIWAYGSGAPSSRVALSVSSSGHLYYTGYYNFSRDLEFGSGTQNFTSSGSSDVYVIKMDTAGATHWIKTFGGTGNETVRALEVTPQENLQIAGSFFGTVDIDPNSSVFNVTAVGQRDCYVLKLDSAGSFISGASFGSSDYDEVYEILVPSENEFYISGYYHNTMDVDPTSGTQNITSNGNTDFYLIRLNTCSPSQSSFTEAICGSYTVPSGNATYSTSGTYNDTIANFSGCDSVMTISLTIFPNNINATVNQTIDGLVAQASGTNLTYTWMDCINNQTVAGATNQTFMPSANGDYAVIVDDGNCIDTSACFSINNVGIEEDKLLNEIVVYPNPTSGIVQIESLVHVNNIDVLDLTGRIVLSYENNETADLTSLTAGVYLIKISTDSGDFVRRVLKL